MDPRALRAWETEWEIATAGAQTAHWGPHRLTWGCQWEDLPGTHLIELRSPDGRSYPVLSALPPLPCSHRWIAKWPEAPRDCWPHPSESALWIEGDALKRLRQETDRASRLTLEPVISPADWSALRALRRESERKFEPYSPAQVEQMIDYLEDRSARMKDARWYLARVDGQAVGSIGRVVLNDPSDTHPLARLQDVDILPEHQGKGHGTRMVRALIRQTLRPDATAVCLRANAQDWPKDWYRKLGFKRVATWARFEVPTL